MRGKSRDKLYDTDLSDAAWAIIEPLLPPAQGHAVLR
jgi:transposase